MTSSDPYTVLGVPRTATAEQITAAYRALAQDAHPDKGGSTEHMAALNAARETLIARAAEFRDPHLAAIKRLVAGKSQAEIRRLLEDIRQHIRSFTQRDRWGNYGGPLDDPRLARHKREAAYLQSLLA